MGTAVSQLQDEGREHSAYGAVEHEAKDTGGAAGASRWLEALPPHAQGLPLWLQRLSAVLLYYALGCAYYGASPTCQWSPLQVFYFICVSIPTIGYGDLVPTTDADKLFTVFYITIGLSVIYAGVSSAIGELFERLEEEAAAKKKKLAAGGAVAGADDDDDSLPPDDRDVARKELVKTLFCVGTVAGTMVAGGVMASGLEGWTFIQGLYWAFQTTTTVGYGDEAMTSPYHMLFASLYALISVAIVGGAFAGMASAQEEAKGERHRRALLRKGLDADMIVGLERVEGEGVDKCDFVVGMLVAMGTVSEADVAPLVKRFMELDADGSGKLDRGDLALFAQQQQMLAANRARRESPLAGAQRVNEVEL